MKLNTAVNFINILSARFSFFGAKNYEAAFRVWYFLCAKILYKKRARKTLMKLTPNNKKVDNKKVDNNKVDINKKVDKKEGRQKEGRQ